MDGVDPNINLEICALMEVTQTRKRISPVSDEYSIAQTITTQRNKTPFCYGVKD